MAQIPIPDNYLDGNDKIGVKQRYKNTPSGNIVSANCFDASHGVNKGKGKVGMGFLESGSPILKIFGCDNCKWIESELCPHSKKNGGDVTRFRHHSNKICSQRMNLPNELYLEGVTMSVKQMLQVKALMDAEFFSSYVLKQHLDGKRDVNDVFGWEKLKADILKDMRKQDEGSKINITKNSLDDLRRTITVKPEVKTLEDDSYAMRERQEEKIIEDETQGESDE